ncbi:MAG: heparinase II/III family protein [Salinivirgaceae bacterium]|nr:heparinase II/III family protein [Salinivirgaceae bacterium]
MNISVLMMFFTSLFSSQNNVKSQEIVQSFKSVSPSDKQWENVPSHPRLFANDARIASLKLQKDDVSEALLLIIKNEAEKNLKGEKIVYGPITGPESFLPKVREGQGRILSLALSYRIFGDKRYLERARAELLQMAKLPSWPEPFLNVGEASLSVGVGLDWLYNDLSPAERDTLTQAIVQKALLPSLLVNESNNNTTWVNGNFNWNQVCHGGLLVGALAIADREPALARQIVARAIKYLPYAGEVYSNDGAYAEGPGYWEYGTTYHVFLIDALRSVFGTTCNLEKFPGFLESTDFLVQAKGPTGNDYNFSDSGDRLLPWNEEKFTSKPVLLWFASERKNSDIARIEIKSLLKARSILLSDSAATFSKKISQRVAFEVLWWSPKVPPLDSVSHLPLHWTASGHLPIATMRSAWNDPMASYIAIKGGTPNNSHGHMDAGSFILEANGERWAMDLGRESYDKMRAAKIDLWNYSQNSNRWTTVRPGPDGHNILRFNMNRQDITGFATISRLPDEKGVIGDVVDLTSLYKSQVEKVTRTVKLLANRSISIQDEWTTGEKVAQYTFQWVTGAKISIQPYGVLLEQNGRSLKLKIEVPNSNAKPEIVIEDVSKSKAMQDSDNPGVSRILIKLKSSAKSKFTLKITAFPIK